MTNFINYIFDRNQATAFSLLGLDSDGRLFIQDSMWTKLDIVHKPIDDYKTISRYIRDITGLDEIQYKNYDYEEEEIIYLRWNYKYNCYD